MNEPLEKNSTLCSPLSVWCALLMLSCGCSHGPDYQTATVSGTVNIDGQPVPKGFITISPTAQSRGAVVGGPIADGTYRCQQVPVGKVRVTFAAQAAEMTTMLDRSTNTKREVPKDILPPQYVSGLEAEVKPGENLLDFALRSTP
jgi:hypothetical protein